MPKPTLPQFSYRDRLRLLSGAAALSLAGCGDGGSNTLPTSAAPPPTPPVAQTPPVVIATPPIEPTAPVDGLLRDTFANNFVVGAAIGLDQITAGTEDSDILAKQFSSITAENVMKPEALSPSEGTYTFEAADALVDFALANGLQLRGHTLLWHKATPDYFFEGTPEDIKTRLQQYVTDVVTHFKGKVFAWDVVNEVVSDDDGATAPYRDSNWYQAVGGADYIDWAFEAARAADPDVKLFINDYSTELEGKRGRLVKVVEDLIARGIPLDGVGHQAHIQQSTTAADVLAGLDAFTNMFATLENHITELDISVYSDPGSCFENGTACQASVGNSLLTARARAQAKLYRELFNGFAARSNLTSVTMWGLTDDGSWLNTFPVERPNYPLLYEADRNPKPAFFAITDPAYPVDPGVFYSGDSFSDWMPTNWHLELENNTDWGVDGVAGGGRRLSAIASTFAADCAAYPSDIVVIQGGVNDISGASLLETNFNGSVTLEALKADISSIVAHAVTKNVCIIIWNIPPHATAVAWSTLVHESISSDYNRWLANEIATNTAWEDVYVFDARAVLDTNGDGALDPAFDNGDGLHPNASVGHPAIAVAIEPIISQACGF